MADTISLDLRRRIVDAYRNGLTETYEATAEMFGVGMATVSRLLRRKRETGDVLPKKARRGPAAAGGSGVARGARTRQP